MSYEVGTHIDLSHLAAKAEVVVELPKSRKVQNMVNFYCEVGTQFLFKFTNQGVQVSRRIPVVGA